MIPYHSRHVAFLVHQTKGLDLLSWGNRHASCLGACNICNAVMFTHTFMRGVCVLTEENYTQTVRRMTDIQIKSVLVGGHPGFFCSPEGPVILLFLNT